MIKSYLKKKKTCLTESPESYLKLGIIFLYVVIECNTESRVQCDQYMYLYIHTGRLELWSLYWMEGLLVTTNALCISLCSDQLLCRDNQTNQKRKKNCLWLEWIHIVLRDYEQIHLIQEPRCNFIGFPLPLLITYDQRWTGAASWFEYLWRIEGRRSGRCEEHGQESCWILWQENCRDS